MMNFAFKMMNFVLKAEDGHLSLVPEAGTTSGSSAAEQAVGEKEAGGCNAATVTFVALLLANTFLNINGSS